MLPDDLDRVLAETGARLAYCTPSIQNPTTATMSLARRQEIVATLARRDALLLEDDPYALLLPEPLPSLAQLMPERVFHVATLAKTLSPGLRTAFLAVPGADHVRRLTAALRATSLTAPGLLTELAADWIESGQARRLLHAIRGELAARQATVRDALGGMATAHPCGPHVWLHLPPELRSREFVAAMRQLGLALVPSDVFTVEGDPPPRARIAIGTASTRDSLEAALSVVATELRHERFDRFDAIV
jgi:DNA-binding transcriptional MocR family regulator